MRRAGPVDAAFFGLEAPGYPMHGMAVMVLDPATVPGGYTFGGLRRFIASRLPGIPPLRQRLVSVPLGLARPGWVDSEVDIGEHVFKHVRTGATLADVASYAAAIATTPLDRAKPLWAMHIIEGLEGGTVAIVAKVHHSLMDGMAGMEFLASMFSLRPQADPVKEVVGGSRRVPSPLTALALAVPEVATTPLRAAQALLHTGQAGLRLRRLARRDRTALLPRAPRLRWNGEVGRRRSMAITSLPLIEVKDVGHTTDSTVNDVVLSVLGGACRAYLKGCGELPDKPLVVLVPVSTHDIGTGQQVRNGRADGSGKDASHRAKSATKGLPAAATANALSLLLSTLGTDIPDPLERLVVVHEAMAHAKRVHDALGSETLTDWLAVANPLVLTAVRHVYLGLDIAAHAPPIINVLVSNVPGPPMPLYFGGARLVGLYPLGPIYDGIGLNVTVVSCADVIGFGLVSSPDALGDLDALTAGIGDEFARLRDACLTRSRGRARRAVPGIS
jgi:diacylglycerol O-acyltransferase / wax synthase